MPVSSVDDLGFCDLLVKIVAPETHPDNVFGEFSQVVKNATVNDQFFIEGPWTKWNYNGYGKFNLDG